MERQKKLKNILAAGLCMYMCFVPYSQTFAQSSKQITNKYSMKLEGSEANGYKLMYGEKYKKIEIGRAHV